VSSANPPSADLADPPVVPMTRHPSSSGWQALETTSRSALTSSHPDRCDAPCRCVAPDDRMLAIYGSHNWSVHRPQRSPDSDNLRDKALANPYAQMSRLHLTPAQHHV